MGPSRKAGKKVSAATITTVKMRRTTNTGVSVRKVPGPSGRVRLPASAPATPSAATSGTKRPNSIARPPSRSANVIPNAPVLPGAFGWTKPV